MCLLSSLNVGSAQTQVETNQYKVFSYQTYVSMLAMDVRHFQSTNEVVNMFWILTSLQLSREIAKGLQIRLFNKCVLHFIASFFLSTVTLTLVMWPQIGWSSFFLGIDSFFLMWNSSRGGCDPAVWPRLLLKVIHEQFPKMSKNANKRSSGENALYHF